jgi:hypothetical protein
VAAMAAQVASMAAELRGVRIHRTGSSRHLAVCCY